MKRIVICADGTWNHRDQVVGVRGKRHPSNVVKIARAVRTQDKHGVPQVVFYHDGLGTGGAIDRWTGGAFGSGMEKNIRTLYRFIIYNHEPGDELYLFGFSRGAFTVRSLVGFMKKVGLTEKEGDYYVPELYSLYEEGRGPGDPLWDRIKRRVKTLTECPLIRFVGVWDTVGALGPPGLLGHLFRRNKYRYHDVGLHDEVQNAYHALAIDERRKPFRPTFWSRPAGWTGQLEQAWFPGAHSNVGGGYDPDGLANGALHWMAEKAEALGLELDRTDYLWHFRACFNAVLNDSMTLTYRLLGNGTRAIGAHRTEGEVLHRSAVDRAAHAECRYEPRGLAAYLADGATPLPVVTTASVPAGAPCRDPASARLAPEH